ncbi:hypothetical protein, partial [Klebsiella pneumoniae]|uniref:hypothetical protein n=1 Tax=Klebsiella pneumoniae TaxID=573 RepID=UPI000FB298CE
KACVLPENPASYRVVRTKSYLFNKAGNERSTWPPADGEFFPPQGCVIKSVHFGDGMVIYVPIQRYIKNLDLWVNAEGTVE